MGLDGKRSLGGVGRQKRVPHGRAVGVVDQERGSGKAEGRTAVMLV